MSRVDWPFTFVTSRLIGVINSLGQTSVSSKFDVCQAERVDNAWLTDQSTRANQYVLFFQEVRICINAVDSNKVQKNCYYLGLVNGDVDVPLVVRSGEHTEIFPQSVL